MKRRGMSEVVTTVIIILIVLAAIVLIWSAIRPTIQSASDQVNADCFTIELETVSCVPSGTVGSYNITVRRNQGAGELGAIKLLVDTNGDVSTLDWTQGLPQQLETATYTSSGSQISAGDSINVAAVLANGQICSPSSNAPVTC